MKTRNSTKSKLLSSVIALVLCVSMLIGATFAWFTDTASTGVNKIMAGTLNVEVEYSTNGTRWATIEDATSLFSNNLWEPGHTEYVYLRVKNAGTLGLKYKVMVTPVSENGGINVNNENFKLSDYLVFGTTDPEATCPNYTRETARNAAGTTMGLNQAGLQKYGEIKAGENAEYLALVVYMPETVGNEANAKPGTVAPSINLGITVVATQLAAEYDSVDNTYDEGAVNDSKYVVGPTYNYFPQVMKTVPVAESGATTIEAKGKLNKDDTTETTLATVTVPAAAVADGTTNLTVKVVPAEATNAGAQTTIAAEIAAGRETANFDIKVEGVKADNEAEITVKAFVGTGLNNVKVYHNGVEITGATYNPADGYVTFTTTSFSDFTVSYDPAVAAIGTKTYGSLANAFAAVKSGETITLLKSSAGNGIKVPSGKNFTVDFNSYTYDVNGELVGSSGTETNSLQLLKDSTITFKNGTLTSTQRRYMSQILIQNYSNLTLDNMTVSAGVPFDYIVSNNNGNVVIKDTTINAAEGKVAFDVCRYSSYIGPVVTVEGNSVINGKVEISSSGAKDGATHQLNVTGGTFNGEIYKYGDSPNFVGNITGGTFVNDVNAFCADGYGALKEGSQYKVIAGNFAKDKASLKAMLADGGTVYLTQNISLGYDTPVIIGKDTVLEGCGYKVSASKEAFKITGTVDVTMRNVTIFAFNKEVVTATTSAGSKLSFENVSISSAFKALHFSDCRETDVTIKGCTLKGTYPFNVNGGTVSSFVVEDTTLNGWTSFSTQKDNGTYQFKNCSFGKGNGYANVKLYGNTTFEGCTFSADYFNSRKGGIASGTTTPITVNFNNCFMTTSDGTTQALTVDLLKTAFNYNIASGSSSGGSTINDQYWYVNNEKITFVTENS